MRTADVAAKFGAALKQHPSLSYKFGANDKPHSSNKPHSSHKPHSSNTFSFAAKPRGVRFGCGGSRSTRFGSKRTRFGGGYGKLF